MKNKNKTNSLSFTNFNSLDERQQKMYYKSGHESFLIMLFLLVTAPMLEIFFGIKWFSGGYGLFAIAYIGVWYFNVRKSMLGCDTTDRNRKSELAALVISMLVSTAFLGWVIITDGIEGRLTLVDEDGVLNFLFLALVAYFSGLVCMIIGLVRNKREQKGDEE